MTHLERYTNSIKRKPFDRIPITIQMTGETAAKLSEFTGLDNGKLIFEIFDVDLRAAGPRYIGPKPAHNDDGTFKNVYGVTFRTVSYGKGTYVESVGHPLADAETVDEIRRYNWPRADMYEYETMFDTLKMYPDYPFMVGGMAIGWDAWEMRGMEKFLEDLYTEEAIADAVINEVSDYGYELYKTICATAKKKGNANFTVVQIADDWGTQDGQLISTKMFRKFFKRHYRRIIDEAHSAGAVVQFHCCGCQLGLIPEFIDLGVDIMNPLQTSAKGMDPRKLKEEYGHCISFSGGIDVQTVLPFGTPQSVRDEVFYLLDTMGKGGGYILHPSHNIQIGTPPENIIAMYDAVYEYYGMPGTGLL